MPRRPRPNLTGLPLHIRAALDPETLVTIRTATNRGQALGNDRFCEMIESAMGRRGEPHHGRRPRRGTGGIDGEQIEFGF